MHVYPHRAAPFTLRQAQAPKNRESGVGLIPTLFSDTLDFPLDGLSMNSRGGTGGEHLDCLSFPYSLLPISHSP